MHQLYNLQRRIYAALDRYQPDQALVIEQKAIDAEANISLKRAKKVVSDARLEASRILKPYDPIIFLTQVDRGGDIFSYMLEEKSIFGNKTLNFRFSDGSVRINSSAPGFITSEETASKITLESVLEAFTIFIELSLQDVRKG